MKSFLKITTAVTAVVLFTGFVSYVQFILMCEELDEAVSHAFDAR